MSDERSSGGSGGIRSRSGLVFLGFFAIAVFFLWEEHKAHLLGALPYVLLLLCPLLHLFHGGHGAHGGGNEQHKDHKKSCRILKSREVINGRSIGIQPVVAVVINSAIFVMFAFSSRTERQNT